MPSYTDQTVKSCNRAVVSHQSVNMSEYEEETVECIPYDYINDTIRKLCSEINIVGKEAKAYCKRKNPEHLSPENTKHLEETRTKIKDLVEYHKIRCDFINDAIINNEKVDVAGIECDLNNSLDMFKTLKIICQDIYNDNQSQ
jgi:hypothetical protein